LITHYFSQSSGREIPIRDMSYSQLVNTINAVARRLGGGTDETLDALRADLARRPAPEPGEAAPKTSVPNLRGSGNAQSRDGTTDPVADPRGLARIGDNNPPDEVTVAERLRARLEAAHEALIEALADHELAAAKLPKSVESDDDVAKINAWVVRARELYREAEGHRKAEKDDYLQAGKTIDAFFGELKDDVAVRAKDIEDRNTPYLQAKAKREEADRLAAAEAKRKAAEEAAERERESQAAAKKAQEEADAALKAIQDAKDDEERLRLEKVARDAAAVAKTENKAAEQAGKDVKAATKSADRDEKIAAGGGRHALGRTSAGGGSSSLKTEWKYRVVDKTRVAASLGPLYPFLGSSVVDDALGRAAKSDPRPDIPGVEYYSEAVTQTR
jgi:hypothetical protein